MYVSVSNFAAKSNVNNIQRPPARSDGVFATVSDLNSAGMYLSPISCSDMFGINGGGT